MPDYAKALNEAQYMAVTSTDSSVLVVAGAGSGKTRTIVYRLAWLAEQGFAPASILLLTFTRKAAHEMLTRAQGLLGHGLEGIPGGTFHSFAFGVLRRHPPEWLGNRPFTLMDSADITQALRQCKDNLKLGKKDTSFPKLPTIAAIISKSRNKELAIEEIMRRDSFHMLPHAQAVADLATAYAEFKKNQGLLDYDDLLFELHDLLARGDWRAESIRSSLSNILVDEYQDTNLVQARIVRLLAAGEGSRVMAVGDEAQSIYAFRGANVRNILDFPKLFPGASVIRLEENYRSTQPILAVANSILANAPESYKKTLFTRREGGEPVRKIRTLSDASEAALIVERIRELLQSHLPHEIAVLFRAGFHSYPLENALRKAEIPFRKYGGLRFIEASHIKDVLSFARLVINPLDAPAFSRVAAMHKGVGAKTAAKLHTLLQKNDTRALCRALARFPELKTDLDFLDAARLRNDMPEEFFERLLDHYRPRMEELYPEDWPSRLPGLEEILQIAGGYDSLDLFVADMALENPDDGAGGDAENCITLSTIHSAKGLEWNAVLLLDLVEDRFPSRHAQARPEDFEEERRLFYVACTRARQILELYVPATVFSMSDRSSVPVLQSPFLRELAPGCTTDYVEKFGATLAPMSHARSLPEKTVPGLTPKAAAGDATQKDFATSGYCRHRIFGRGKIIKKIDDEKMQVNFPGFGLKVILSDYLIMED